MLGTEDRPLRIAIVGAGPSGFFAAGALFQQKNLQVQIDMFDRLPAPFGLVRYGVAPDHPKIKSVTKVYERTAANPNFRFFGNVDFGTDITLEELRQHYDRIIFAVGAQADRRLNIPGEDLDGSISATEFVAWYNGHPDYADLDVDLSIENVLVVGVGNVAMDVARILAKTVDELRDTDIADHALEKLAQSRVKNIYIVARRGPAQVKFTNAEVREFGELSDAEPTIKVEELAVDPLSAKEIESDNVAQRNLEILREFAEREPTGKSRRVHFRFLESPVELSGEDGKITAARIEHNELRAVEGGYLNAVGTGKFETRPVGLVLRSVGYRGVPLPDVPYDKRTGTIPNRQGRVYDPETGNLVPGLYVVGWAKRGPSGVIGTNKPDAVETVEQLLEDMTSTPGATHTDADAIPALLRSRNVPYVDMDAWRKIDEQEVQAGEPQGRPRVKFVTGTDLLHAAGIAPQGTPAPEPVNA
ncbi:MAG: FAD-dependent oxidoreductase [Litorilinea sp.]